MAYTNFWEDHIIPTSNTGYIYSAQTFLYADWTPLTAKAAFGAATMNSYGWFGGTIRTAPGVVTVGDGINVTISGKRDDPGSELYVLVEIGECQAIGITELLVTECTAFPALINEVCAKGMVGYG